MKIVGIMPVRNEQWVLGLSARVALQWVDELLIGLHDCTDASAVIIKEVYSEYPGRLTIATRESGSWHEMHHRQRLLDVARDQHATHIALIDADEVLCADSLPHVRRWADALMPGECLNVNMYCPWRSLHQYRVDKCIWHPRNDLALVFRDSPNLSFAPGKDGYQHHARAPRGSVPVYSSLRRRYARRTTQFPQTPDLGVMHLQWVSWRRLVAKHARYKMHERLTNPNATTAWINETYGRALDETGLRLAEVPASWWAGYEDWMKHVNIDDVPWFEGECQRMLAEHGVERFEGLDLFGVV